MRRISVFGATGSIGQNTLDLLRRQGGAETQRIVALSGGQNIDLLIAQAKEFKPEIALTSVPENLPTLRDGLAGTGIETAAGTEALAEAADRPTDWTMSAIVGAAGLVPGLRALAHGGVLALANKETMVAAGALAREAAENHGATLLPVDSEHSAIFQALTGEDRREVDRVILTASGGPFRDWTLAQMQAATPEQAVAHPNWSMGQRISIDSASMFNKALEVIEAHELFGIDARQIEVIVHPQSIIHSLVGFRDGAIMAHLGPSDMRGAIGYALNWPKRRDLPLERLDLAALSRLEFSAPDSDRFPALRLAYEVLETGGLAGAAFNAAKERALDAFIARQIGFCDMAGIVETVLTRMHGQGMLAMSSMTLENVLNADQLARNMAAELIPAA